MGALRNTHGATIAALQRIVAGGAKLAPAEALAASDLLASLESALRVDPVIVYKIEDGCRLARLREGRDASQWGDDPPQRDKAHQAALARFTNTKAPAAA
jgi:hypothetical protein